jgi:hypothetical protein
VNKVPLNHYLIVADKPIKQRTFQVKKTFS